METIMARDMATDIADLVCQQINRMPKGTVMRVLDSIREGKKMVSVGLYDHGGYPLFSINVDLQDVPSMRQNLREVLKR